MTDGLDNCVRELVCMGKALHRAESERNQARAEAERYRAALEKIAGASGTWATEYVLRKIAKGALEQSVREIARSAARRKNS